MERLRFGIQVCDKHWGPDYNLPSPFFVVTAILGMACYFAAFCWIFS